MQYEKKKMNKNNKWKKDPNNFDSYYTIQDKVVLF